MHDDASRADDGAALSSAEMLRYSRHLLLPEVGVAGQRRLRDARVLLVGAGGLGSPAALYLAAAGVGTIALVDDDVVDVTNLQRQIIHDTLAVGRPKTDTAAERLAALNPGVRVERHPVRLTAANALDVLRGHALVVDGSDNFPTRYLVNDACVLLGIPYIYGSVHRFEGQLSVFATPEGPCYRCLFREPPPAGLVPSCAEAGVLGVIPGIIGTLQAAEALKLLLGTGEPLIGRLLLVDARRMHFHTVALRRDPACPACGTRELRTLSDTGMFCDAPAARGGDVPELEPAALAHRLAAHEELVLVDVREPAEWELGTIPGARLVPLGTLPGALHEVARERELVLYCQGGTRSAAALRLLREAGFTRLWSLAGGIARWRTEKALEVGNPDRLPGGAQGNPSGGVPGSSLHGSASGSVGTSPSTAFDKSDSRMPGL